jgi:hypothetical protein
MSGHSAERDAGRWVAVDCAVADVIRLCEHVKPVSSKTDLGGTYGEPEVFTEWAVIYPSSREVPILREHRWPGPEGEPDAKPCEHYVPADTRVTSPGEGRDS